MSDSSDMRTPRQWHIFLNSLPPILVAFSLALLDHIEFSKPTIGIALQFFYLFSTSLLPRHVFTELSNFSFMEQKAGGSVIAGSQ